MSNSTPIDDDYVAELLKRDAANIGSGNASLGGRSRPRPEGVRPNARFLKNLVRDIDSHNTALKQKEEHDIIGPHPAPRPTARGRGAQNPTSIDAHFKASYDPKADVTVEEERDDWDMALEALRDRARWKQSGAERLRAAGFTEEEIGNWQNGTKNDGEKSIDDVKWKKKGEREWDRGKVLEEDHVEQRPEWGRLKDT
ncbi:hypothetical protein BST61_g2737 [Cercospora zeina]